MIVFVAYEDNEKETPVALGDSMASLGAQLGISSSAVFNIISGRAESSKQNKFGRPLTIRAVEIAYDPRTDTDYDLELDLEEFEDDLADVDFDADPEGGD